MDKVSNEFSRRNFVKGLVFIGGGIAVFGIEGCGNNPATNTTGTTEAPKQPLKVGIEIPYTGSQTAKGIPMGDGVLDAIKYINDELGGVMGYKIDPVWRDSGYDTAKAATIMNEFLSNGCLLFTTQASGMMTAMMGLANDAKFPGFTVYSAPAITHPALHIYAQTPDYGDDWAAFSKYYLANIWKGTGRPKMAMMILNNSTGYGARDAANSLAAKLGIDIVATEEHTPTLTDATESLVRVRAKSPNVVYISSTPPTAAIVIKNLVTLGMYPGVTVGMGHGSTTKALVDAVGNNNSVEGIYGVFPTVSWGENVSGMAKMTEYCQKLHPNDYGNADYITAWNEGLIIGEILKQAIINTPGGAAALTPQNVESYGFKKLNNYDVSGLQGPATYVVGDNRLSKAVRIFQIKSGVIAPISGWTDAPYFDL
jgi:branched-chain amino acid transport system substrate-binding protein